jgi:signal transduction histidine kinase
MFIVTYAAAILSTIFVVIAAVFFTYKTNQVRTVLASYLLTGAIWIGGNAAADVSYTNHALILLSQFAYSGGVANLFFCILLVDILIDGHIPKRSRLVLYFIPTIVCIVAGFSPYAILDIYFPVNEPAQIVPGLLYTYTIYLYLAGLLYCIVRLWQFVRQRQVKFERRVQFSLILGGLIFTSLSALIFDVLLPLSGELHFYTLGSIGSLFFASACGYAITRHQFLSITLVIQRGALYTILSGLLIVCFFAALQETQMFFGDGSDTSILLSVTFTTLTGLIIVPRFERWFRRWTDRWFFKDTYNYAEAIHTLSEIVSTSQTSKEVVVRVEKALISILRVSSVHIVLFLKKKSNSDVHTAKNQLAIPIIHKGKAIGLIAIGPKRSGEAFASEDTQLLDTFVFQAANALLRVSLSQKVERHARNLEQTVQKKTREILALQEKQKQMILDVSHNLQTPLAIFQVQLERSKGLYLTDTAFTGLQHSLSTVSSFIYDLLALTAMQNTLTHEPRTLCNISLLLHDLVDELQIICTDTGIQVKSDITEPVLLHCNEKRIREALMNVISNAVKYIGTKGDRSITISLQEFVPTVQITISDTGIGISPEALPHIFDRFYRATSVGDSASGTGLGLAIAKSIIEEHNGTMTVSSVVGCGTTFVTTLPKMV